MKTSEKGSVAVYIVVAIIVLAGAFGLYHYFTTGKVAPETSLDTTAATTSDTVVRTSTASDVSAGLPPGSDGMEPPAKVDYTKAKIDASSPIYVNQAYKFKVAYPVGWTVGSDVFDGRGSLLAVSFCPPSLTVAGDCKHVQTDKEHVTSSAPFLVYVTLKSTPPTASKNKVVWNHGDYTYEIDQNDDAYADVFEQILSTFKFL